MSTKCILILTLIICVPILIARSDDSTETDENIQTPNNVKLEVQQGKSKDSYRYFNLNHTREAIILHKEAMLTRYDGEANKIGHLKADLIIAVFDTSIGERILTVGNGDVNFNYHNICVTSERVKMFPQEGIIQFDEDVKVKQYSKVKPDCLTEKPDDPTKKPDELYTPRFIYDEIERKIIASGGVKFKFYIERIVPTDDDEEKSTDDIPSETDSMDPDEESNIELTH